MTILRVGLGENKKFADGYDAIFRKKKSAASVNKPVQAKSKKAAKPARKK